MFEPLVIRRSYAPGKMVGYGRATAGRLPEAGWLTERPLSLHLNKDPSDWWRETPSHTPEHTHVWLRCLPPAIGGWLLNRKHSAGAPSALRSHRGACLDRKWQMGQLGQSFRVNSSNVSGVLGVHKLFCWALPRRCSQIYNQLNKAVVDNKPGAWSIEM